MFIGHYAVALAAKRVAPQINLGILFAAVQWPDLVWPLLLLTGDEEVLIEPGHVAFSPLHFTHYPISHSLLANLGWAGLFALSYGMVTRQKREAWLLGLAVMSHWLLDAIVHEPDLPITPGSSLRVGLGLWHSLFATIAVEGLMLVSALWLYVKEAKPQGRARLYSFWLLIGLLVLMYLSGPFSPPPGNVDALAMVALSGWVVPLLAGWIDTRAGQSKSPHIVQNHLSL
jgi:hypothetical protein